MRGLALILVAMMALEAGCSRKAPPAQPAPVAPAPVAAAVAQPAPQVPPTPSATPAYAPPLGTPVEQIVRFSPSDYAAKERRIDALINNAESRDTSGETQYVADRSRAERQHCTSRACIEHSYAAEEALLRKWEGSSDIN